MWCSAIRDRTKRYRQETVEKTGSDNGEQREKGRVEISKAGT